MGGGVGKSIENSVGLRSDWCRVVSAVGHKEERGVAGHVSGSGVEAIGRSGCFGRCLDRRQNSEGSPDKTLQDVTLPRASGKAVDRRKKGDFKERSGRGPGPDYVIRRSILLLEMAFGADLTGVTGEQLETGHVEVLASQCFDIQYVCFATLQ